jgi:class 3 adenylate cyclase
MSGPWPDPGRAGQPSGMTIALITGASRGLGAHTARRLAARGVTVLAGVRDPAGASGRPAVEGIRPIGLDVTDDRSVAAAARTVADTVGPIDVLVNNAGVHGTFAPAEEVEPAELAEVLATNVVGPVRVTRAFLPLLRRGRDPRLVMVSSGTGSMTALVTGRPRTDLRRASRADRRLRWLPSGQFDRSAPVECPLPEEAPARRPPPGASVRPVVWLFHMLLPMFGLWLLVAHPVIDLGARFYLAHFFVVSISALVSFGVGYLVNEAARRRADVRLFLVGMAFLASAGFLFVHAICTPTVMVDMQTAGFEASVPIGLAIAAVFAALSGVDFAPPVAERILARARLTRTALLAVLVAWAAVSLTEPPMLSGANAVEHIAAIRWGLAIGGGLLYLVAALRYYVAYRRRRGVVLLSVVTAFLMLGEALVSIPIAPMWHLSWWLWHLLLMLGFCYVGYSAHIQYRREGDAAGLFDAISAQQTVARLRDEYGAALESLVALMQRGEGAEGAGLDRDIEAAAHALGDRFGLNEGQTAVLIRAAQALAGERTQLARLGALVRVGRETSVVRSDEQLLAHSLRHIEEGFDHHRVRIGLVADDRLTFPAALGGAAGLPAGPGGAADPDGFAEPDGAARATEPTEDGDGGLLLPLLVKGQPSGVLQVRRDGGPFAARDRALLESLAAQLSVALENQRLYQQRDGLIRQYMSPDVADTLLSDPAAAKLGGALVEVTALFADLRGFTTMSEQVTPHEIVELLNRYFAAATDAVLGEGGTVVQFVGDALMALFNAPVEQADHPLRAARAALRMQRAIEELGGGPDRPRFRVGVNTGAALVGNIGSDQLRNFNAMGDAVNVAARLESSAEPGTVLISRATLGRLPGGPRTTSLGRLELKGRSGSIEAFTLHELA